MALKYKKKIFFFLLCISLSRLQQVGKQLLLKGKLTFKIKPATSTERKMTSCGDGRDINISESKTNFLALIEV